MPTLFWLTPSSLLVELPPKWATDVGGRQALQRASLGLGPFTDAVITENALLLVANQPIEASKREKLGDAIAQLISHCENAPITSQKHKVIQVVYDGDDLEEAARIAGISVKTLIEKHSSSEFVVSFLGFAPGFAYLRGLDPSLCSIPRRADPRPRVPRGAVGIAAGMSAIYPGCTPGGWHLIASAPFFDPFSDPLLPGDRVSFSPIDWVRSRNNPIQPRHHVDWLSPHLEVTACCGISNVVDLIPTRRLSMGTPPGGPLAPFLAHRACARLPAHPGDTVIEFTGSLTIVLRNSPPRWVADVEGRLFRLKADVPSTFHSPRSYRVGYLAVEGGFELPTLFGGKGALPQLGCGPHGGRPMRRGDRLPLGCIEQSTPKPVLDIPNVPLHASVCAHASPWAPPALPKRILARISSQSDRMGTRVIPDTTLPRPSPLHSSLPAILGMIQLTPSGQLIVLGPDHPITCGYPPIATLSAESAFFLFSLPMGSEIELLIEP
ncbi:MAG: carboxyltransferase domain-containing protein [Sandaracinaceae bacterium]|nr:carboxyltransferase domain-containing protein [Sandaracinaceae bacterium]